MSFPTVYNISLKARGNLLKSHQSVLKILNQYTLAVGKSCKWKSNQTCYNIKIQCEVIIMMDRFLNMVVTTSFLHKI